MSLRSKRMKVLNNLQEETINRYYSGKLNFKDYRARIKQLDREIEKMLSMPKLKQKKQKQKQIAKPKQQYVMRKIKRKNGGTYERKVLSEKYKTWRNQEAKRLRRSNEFFRKRKLAIKRVREGWKYASYWDPKTNKMIYYKDIMTFKEYINMRFPIPKDI